MIKHVLTCRTLRRHYDNIAIERGRRGARGALPPYVFTGIGIEIRIGIGIGIGSGIGIGVGIGIGFGIGIGIGIVVV